MNPRRRRKPTLSDCRTMDDFVRGGFARAVNPTTDTGWRKYGNGRIFLPAATNVIPDPQGVLADGTFWPASTTDTTITGNVDAPIPLPEELSGLTKCLRLVNDGTADTPVTANVTVTASKDYWTSVYAYAPTLGGNLTIVANIKDDAHTFNVAALTGANAGWVRYSVKSATVATETTLKLQFVFAGGTASTVYVTGAGAVQGTTLTPFFCGLSPWGGAWSGTANASASTRAVSRLVYANPFPTGAFEAAGTIAGRAIPMWADNCGIAHFLVTTTGGTGYAWYYHSTSWAMRYNAPTARITNDNGVGPGDGASTSFVARFNNGTSGAVDQILGSNPQCAQVTFNETGATGWTSIGIGSSATDGTLPWTGYIGPLAIPPNRITDAETATLKAMVAAGYPAIDLAKWSRGAGYKPLIIPLEDNSTAYMVT